MHSQERPDASCLGPLSCPSAHPRAHTYTLELPRLGRQEKPHVLTSRWCMLPKVTEPSGCSSGIRTQIVRLLASALSLYGHTQQHMPAHSSHACAHRLPLIATHTSSLNPIHLHSATCSSQALAARGHRHRFRVFLEPSHAAQALNVLLPSSPNSEAKITVTLLYALTSVH